MTICFFRETSTFAQLKYCNLFSFIVA